ncbi:MAG: flagellar basal body-associated protein FliL [Pseudobdellovibrionaceae bacterium]
MSGAKSEQEKPKGDGAKKLMGPIFALVNLLVSGAGAYMVYAGTLGWKNPEITEEMEKPNLEAKIEEQDSRPYIFTMEKFTVNLDGEPRRAIRVEVNLELLGKEGFEEVVSDDMRVRARDKIVKLLGEKNYSELETIQGKLFLKDQITLALNDILHDGVIKDIYFSDFVVQ